MASACKTAMAELPENEAEGALARIYEELRRYCGVPYVSSLQRHVATMPGCLEYAWAALRPAFRDGTIPETAWRRASAGAHARFPDVSAAALRLWGVDADGLRAIRNICENFIRVAPINLLFAGCLERLIGGAAPGGKTAARSSWTPPAMLPPMPGMADLAAVAPDIRAVLMTVRTEIDGKTFVPGLYRQLAHWPGYLAHASALIAPVLNDAAARRERAAIADGIIAAADDIITGLPSVPDGLAPPSAGQRHAIVAAIKTYRVTSPEMIVFGTLLRDALPADAA